MIDGASHVAIYGRYGMMIHCGDPYPVRKSQNSYVQGRFPVHTADFQPLKGGMIFESPHLKNSKLSVDSIAEKVEKLTARLKALDELYYQVENTDIVGIVRENGLSIDQLAH